MKENKLELITEGEESDPYSMLIYAVRSKLTGEYYISRLRRFFDFPGVDQLNTVEARCNVFAELGKGNNSWLSAALTTFNLLATSYTYNKFIAS